MPASEIMSKFRAGTLHSGRSGKVVTNPRQAKAIQLSYARKENEMISPRMVTSRGRTGARPTLPPQASPTATAAVGRTGNRPSPIQPPSRRPMPYEGRTGMIATKTGPVRPLLGSFKKGGKVKKTGAYKLHKGEKVVPLSSLS